MTETNMGNKNDVEKETTIFLNFQNKLGSSLPTDKKFIRIIPFRKSSKDIIIQINDLIFKGEFMMGTNLFFKKISAEDSAPVQDDRFDNTAKKYELFDVCRRVFNCEVMKIKKDSKSTTEKNNMLQFNFDWKYSEVLKKFEKNELNVEDMILKNVEVQPVEQQPVEKQTVKQQTVDVAMRNVDEPCDGEMSTEPKQTDSTNKDDEINSSKQKLLTAYKTLQLLARTPVKRIPEES